MTKTSFVLRQILSIGCVLLLLPATALLMAQEPGPPMQAPPSAQAFSPDQLDNMVAPIALYPDRLLSQVLVAATYPLEVVEAAQWLQQNRDLQGQQLVDAARQQSWDASIQALVVFPDVLNRLNSNVRWTTDLGNAFLAQQADVMNAVQRMRAQARAEGKLSSNPQETVTTQTQGDRTVIEIQPANPQVVYVPAYNPEYIWGPPAYGYYPPLYYPDYGFGFGFGPGIYIGSFFGGLGWGGWGWWPNWYGCSIFVNPFFFHHYGYRGFYGGGGFRGGGLWAHSPEHRMGVPYPNGQLANRFHGVSGGGSVGRGQFGGSVRQANPGNNSGFRGSTGANARVSGSSPNSAQAGGWHRFGESRPGNTQGLQRSAPTYQRTTPSYGSNSYGANRTVPSYRPSPSYGSGSGSNGRTTPSYRPSPSYSGSNSYGANRTTPSYRPSPSYGGGSGSYAGHTTPSYRSSPSYGSGYRPSPSYGAARSYNGGGSSYHSSGGGGSYHSTGGGGSYHSSGGGGSSHGGGARR